MRGAAEAAVDRKAWGKARRFTQRWAKAQPLDPAISDMEADILRQKALAKIKAGRPEVADALIAEAGTINAISQTMRLQLAVVEYLLRWQTKQAPEAVRARWSTTAWLFEIHLIPIVALLDMPKAWVIPAEPPSVEEWPQMIAAMRALNCFGPDLLEDAALRGAETLSALGDFQFVQRALRHGRRYAAEYAVARVGNERFPEDFMLLEARYEVALRLKRPKAEFNGALGVLSRAESAIVKQIPWVPENAYKVRLARLLGEVRAYLKSAAKKTQRSQRSRLEARTVSLTSVGEQLTFDMGDA